MSEEKFTPGGEGQKMIPFYHELQQIEREAARKGYKSERVAALWVFLKDVRIIVRKSALNNRIDHELLLPGQRPRQKGMKIMELR
jgi:hypothetical protein